MFKNLAPEHLIQLINAWKNNSFDLNNWVVNDAKKEFSSESQLGYGLDGGSVIKNKDFESVRGSYDQNSFVKELKEDLLLIQKRADRLIRFFEKM